MLSPSAPEHEIAAVVQHCVGLTRTILQSHDGTNGRPTSPEALAQALDELAMNCQAKPVEKKTPLSGRIDRMLDPQWWTRNLRRQLLREYEAIQQAMGNERRTKDCYVSEHTMKRLTARAKSNRNYLESQEAVNDDGAVIDLVELIDGSVSNPKNRRNELMVQIKGFEEYANRHGHVAVFLTITCPSRFHRFDAAGNENKKWSVGNTPLAAQQYLCNVWGRIRAELKRRGIIAYGIRVAEPHHDGCPHWHLLLFTPASSLGCFSAQEQVTSEHATGKGLLGVVGCYALADSPGEKGASQHRFKVELIDRAKGSAVGYVAKYVCKNIDGRKDDGDDMGLDFDSGKSASDASQRVKAWASVWGIRQFQFTGGPSVTVWRELRRVEKKAKGPVLADEVFEGPRAAADQSKWGDYWALQGGHEVPSRKLSLSPFYVGDSSSGKYREEIKRIRGVRGQCAKSGRRLTHITRVHTWTVQRRGQHATNLRMMEWRGVLTPYLKQPASPGLQERLEVDRGRFFQRIGEAFAPWTRVNNCTEHPMLPIDSTNSSTSEPTCFSHTDRQGSRTPHPKE
jgi:hypothetical protein